MKQISKTFWVIMALGTTSALFGTEKTICQDGIGSQIVINYYPQQRGTIITDGKPVTPVQYLVTGPATKSLSYFLEDPASFEGYYTDEGLFYLDLSHQRSSRAFKGHKNNRNQFMVEDFYHRGNTIWEFGFHCKDE